jgi:hypothetical protein
MQNYFNLMRNRTASQSVNTELGSEDTFGKIAGNYEGDTLMFVLYFKQFNDSISLQSILRYPILQ